MSKLLNLFKKKNKVEVNKINYPIRELNITAFNQWCKELNVSVLYKR